MSNRKNNFKTKLKSTFIKRINSPIISAITGSAVGGFIASIFTAIVLLVLEFQTGVYKIIKVTSNNFLLPLWIVASITTFVFLLFSIWNFIIANFRSDKYFRENFSFLAFCVILSSFFGLILSVFGQLMFWYPVTALLYISLGIQTSASKPAQLEYIVVFLITFSFYQFAVSHHKNWDGRKSREQYEREQKHNEISMFAEFMIEIKRFFQKKYQREEYLPIDENKFLNPLKQSHDFISQAWEDQLRELICLSSSSYAIDDDGWHDSQNYWVGKDRNTGKMFFLYPANSQLSNEKLNAFLHSSKGFAKSQNCEICEWIVGFRESESKSTTKTNLYQEIRFETEQHLLDQLIDFKNYFDHIESQVIKEKLTESSFSINDVYVPSVLLSSDGSTICSSNTEEYLCSWIDEPGQRQIAILGEYGQGKSSTALMFTYHLIFGINPPLLAENSLPKRIPILVELRGKSPRDLDEFQFLATWSVKYRIDANALMRLNIAGRLILIFEGFDEMVLIGNSDFRRKHFTKLWNFCYQNAKIIITGRPNFFLDDKELIAALGIIKSSNNPYCEAFKLSPFSIDGINKALRNHPDFVREQICELAKNNPRFFDLVSRPSLLHLVSILWEKEKFYENADLLNSAYVLEKFVKHSYSRQGAKEKDSREFMSLNNSERDYFMCGVASYMASKQLSNQINKEQFNDLIEKLIANIPDSISTSTSEICGEVTRPLKSRIKKRPDDLIHIQNE
jgi:hypothetical protein